MRSTLLIGLGLLTACGGQDLQFDDDVDLTLDFVDFTPFAGSNDHLHTPYVQGAPVTVFVRHWRNNGDLAGHRVTSSDPGVFEVLGRSVQDDGDLWVEGYAVSPGTADLVVTDADGVEIDSAPVEVALPDRVELHASGPMFVDLDGLEQAPRVLVDGTATFQVRYFEGDRKLYGNEALSLAWDDGIEAETDRTFLFENREWLRVTPREVGSHEIDLYVDGELVDMVSIDAVEASVIDDLTIEGRDESHAEEGDWLVLYAQSFAGASRVYGVEYDWTIDGEQAPGQGDLYRYEFLPDAAADVQATFDDLTASVTASVGEGYVSSSNNVGCATSGGAGGLLGVLLATGALFTRRRA